LPLIAVAVLLAGGLAACGSANLPSPAALQPRGATVAFDSIDGPPPEQFQALVRSLNDEAQIRHLAVVSREGTSAYRVRGYLTAKTTNGRTTIAWLWDVFDRDGHRALHINGEEAADGPAKDKRPDIRGASRDASANSWRDADNAVLRKIARASMDRLAAFLTSPEASPNAAGATAALSTTPTQARPIQQIGLPDTSPEANGIYRIFQAHADPALRDDSDLPDGPGDSNLGKPPGDAMVPLPPRRPDNLAARAAGDGVILAAADR
jgi:hypothetical protein